MALRVMDGELRSKIDSRAKARMTLTLMYSGDARIANRVYDAERARQDFHTRYIETLLGFVNNDRLDRQAYDVLSVKDAERFVDKLESAMLSKCDWDELPPQILNAFNAYQSAKVAA